MTLHHLTNYHNDPALLAEIRALLAPSYEEVGHFALKGLDEPVPGMEVELYTLRDEAGALAAFCTVGYYQLAGDWYGYVGLTAVRESKKGKGYGIRLWKQLYTDCRYKEAAAGHRILLYFTTASPLVFEWFATTLCEPAPTTTGQCHELGRQQLRTLAATQYPQATWDAATPYLLRRAAPDVRYSVLEYQRATEMAARHSSSFFTSVALDERNGDRLLVVGFAP
ncbi:MAG: hypothetical protein ACRYFX_30735 [Janthinobacterium lividum]